MYDLPSGVYFRAFLSSSDLTTAAPLVLLDRDGNTITLTLGQRPIFNSIVFNNGGTASIITLFQDANGDGVVDAGESLYAANLPANAQSPGYFGEVGLHGKRLPAANGLLKVKASAASANTTVIVTGIIANS